MSDIHADRRRPESPDQPLDLAEAGEALLREAKAMSSGRAAKTLTPGKHAQLKQTMIALRQDVTLGEHDTNGPATIYLLRGRAVVHAGDASTEITAGGWAVVPEERHDLQALEDTVALITVGAVGHRATSEQ
jgi:quercetin dioxygenase-like cupin family protein